MWKIPKSLKTQHSKNKREFISEIDPAFAKASRRGYLIQRNRELRSQIKELSSIRSEPWMEELIGEEYVAERKKEMDKNKRELKRMLSKKKDDIDDLMVEQANEYPIEEILDVNSRGFCICPFHDDTNPSAYCKNNYLYCFSCQTSADVIKIQMHLTGQNFVEAVKALQ